MTEPKYRIADIIQEKADKYELTLFARDHIAWLEKRLFEKRNLAYLQCLASGRDRRAYPEEIVFQEWGKNKGERKRHRQEITHQSSVRTIWRISHSTSTYPLPYETT